MLASQGLCSVEVGPYYCTDLDQFGHYGISEPLEGTKTTHIGHVLSHHIKLICRLFEGVNANSKCCCSNHIVSVSCVEILQLQDQHIAIYRYTNTETHTLVKYKFSTSLRCYFYASLAFICTSFRHKISHYTES